MLGERLENISCGGFQHLPIKSDYKIYVLEKKDL